MQQAQRGADRVTQGAVKCGKNGRQNVNRRFTPPTPLPVVHAFAASALTTYVCLLECHTGVELLMLSI